MDSVHVHVMYVRVCDCMNIGKSNYYVHVQVHVCVHYICTCVSICIMLYSSAEYM